MNNEELKKLLLSKHINSWVHLYKGDSHVRDLLSIFGIEPKTDFEIYKILYMFMNDISTIPTAYCGKKARYKNFQKGFYKFCDDYIINKKNTCNVCHEMYYKNRTNKTKSTLMGMYGVSNVSQIQEVKKKKEKTNMERYGVSTNLQTSESKEKIKQTNIERYGCEYPNQNPEIFNKVKETNLKKYGVEFQSKRNEVKEKAKNTNILKYGTEYSLSSPTIREKINKTNLERYGGNPLSNKIIQDKIKNTNILKYNSFYPMSNLDVQKKVHNTNVERYGVKHPSQNNSIIEKMKETTKNRYGAEHYSQTDEYKEKMSLAHLDERYTIIVENIDKNYIPLFENTDLMMKVNTDEYPFWCEYCDDLFYSKYKNHKVKCKCQKNNGHSLKEKELVDYIKSLIPNMEIIENDRSVLKPKELDVYIPELKLAIEFNGVYWHNDENINSTKHQDKVLDCLKHGVNLIHIYEDEWDNPLTNKIIKERLKNKLLASNRIYARKCTVRNIDKQVSNKFVKSHHIQGVAQASIHIGLYYGCDLVAVMTFGKSRFDKNYEYELIRYCSSGTVVGGASKLLKYFETVYNPQSLLTYADMDWSNGNLYTVLGFELDSYTEPGYFYYDPQTHERISRQKCQKHKLIKKGHDINLTERQICCDVLGYYKIYNSGNIKYTKKY
ncbi:endonuclease domain-containing protein [Escherichia phage ph0011]|nr:endonuclease domain-containing protein [Escherichia phage ph0011]